MLAFEDSAGTKINYSQDVVNLPDGAVFDIDNRIFMWLPRYDQAGTYEITFQGQASSSYSQKVTVMVDDVDLRNWFEGFWQTYSKPLD